MGSTSRAAHLEDIFLFLLKNKILKAFFVLHKYTEEKYKNTHINTNMNTPKKIHIKLFSVSGKKVIPCEITHSIFICNSELELPRLQPEWFV